MIMMVLKTSLNGTILFARSWRVECQLRMVPSMTFLGHIFTLICLGHYVPCYLLWPLVTSILTWAKKKFFFYKNCTSFNELSNAICRLSLRFVFFFLDLKRSRKGSPARYRDFQSPPGIGLNQKVCASCERGYAQYLHRIETGPHLWMAYAD